MRRSRRDHRSAGQHGDEDEVFKIVLADFFANLVGVFFVLIGSVSAASLAPTASGGAGLEPPAIEHRFRVEGNDVFMAPATGEWQRVELSRVAELIRGTESATFVLTHGTTASADVLWELNRLLSREQQNRRALQRDVQVMWEQRSANDER